MSKSFILPIKKINPSFARKFINEEYINLPKDAFVLNLLEEAFSFWSSSIVRIRFMYLKLSTT